MLPEIQSMDSNLNYSESAIAKADIDNLPYSSFTSARNVLVPSEIKLSESMGGEGKIELKAAVQMN